MLARLQKATTLLLIALAAAWAAWSVATGRPDLAWAGAAMIALGYGGILAVEFFMLWRSYSKSDANRPTLWQVLACWMKECAVAPRVFLWRQPFRSRVHADLLATGPGQRRGVVLVHGFLCNRGVWSPWLRRLRAAGIPCIAVDLEPVFGSIDSYTSSIDRAVAALTDATGQPPVVVAHSMGGLAVRAWIAHANKFRFHHVVTIATPHHGTRIARHGFSLNLREMGIRSEWLESLHQREDPATFSRFTCFWSHCDNVVFPTANATLAGADNRHLAATPHVRMVFHPSVIEEVLRLLAEPPPVSRSASSIRRSGPSAASPRARG